MILDASAVVAIVLREEGHQVIEQKAQLANALFIGAPTALESAIVLSGRIRGDSRPLLAALLRRLNAEIIEFNEHHYDVAFAAFLRFGKGRHPAALNFGDCISYALASVSGLPLLFRGNDFAPTDIQCA
jgi:ribonuclease VapC